MVRAEPIAKTIAGKTLAIKELYRLSDNTHPATAVERELYVPRTATRWFVVALPLMKSLSKMFVVAGIFTPNLHS